MNAGATRRTGKDEVLRTGLSSTCFHRDTGGFLEGRWDKWMPQLPKIPQQVSIDLPYLATRAAATVCGAGSIQPGRTGWERHFYGKAKPSGGSILIFRAPAESRKRKHPGSSCSLAWTRFKYLLSPLHRGPVTSSWALPQPRPRCPPTAAPRLPRVLSAWTRGDGLEASETPGSSLRTLPGGQQPAETPTRSRAPCPDAPCPRHCAHFVPRTSRAGEGRFSHPRARAPRSRGSKERRPRGAGTSGVTSKRPSDGQAGRAGGNLQLLRGFSLSTTTAAVLLAQTRQLFPKARPAQLPDIKKKTTKNNKQQAISKTPASESGQKCY